MEVTEPQQRAHDGDVVQLPVPFEALYRDQYAGVVALVYSLAGSRAAAEDLAQEAFLRAHREWTRVGEFDQPGAWVRRVALNLGVSRYRRMRSEARTRLRLRAMANEASPELEPASETFWMEVRRLPNRQAQVVALRYVEDRTIADIAAILGGAEGTVKATLHAARNRLATRLKTELEL